MTELKRTLITAAKAFGADLVGFASIDRFSGVPQLNHPCSILPTCKSVIGLGFRVLRGSLRGIEEGTVYYQYTTMGIELLEETYMPTAMMRLSSTIEDLGYVAAPQKNYQLIKAEAHETNPEMNYKKIYRGVDMPQLDFCYAAYACGLGEIGKSGHILTTEFGPFQRFCFILTDADVEPDELKHRQLCDDCGMCAKACHGGAMHQYENGDYSTDSWQCAAYMSGASGVKNPFLAPDTFENIEERMRVLRGEKQLTEDEAKLVMDALHFYPPMKHSYATNVCGRACDRACYSHLEENGRLSKKFAHPFRSGEEWKIDTAKFEASEK